jgi:hypothetical protein
MPYRGSVAGLIFRSNASTTAGTATFTVFIDGESQTATVNWTTGLSRGKQMWNQGTYPFEPDEEIDVRVTTSSTFAPATADIAVTLFCTFEPE